MNTLNQPESDYLALLEDILKHGTPQIDRIGVTTFSVFGRQIRFDLEKGFPLLTTKKVFWKGIAHELYWFMTGQTNIKYLVDNNVHIWDDYPYKLYKEKVSKGEMQDMTKEEFIEKIAKDQKFAEQFGELKHIYGEMWRAWPAIDGRKIDQLAWVIEEIVRDPDCHNALVNSWNPQFLYGMAKPDEALRFPICHNMFQFSVREGKLSCQLYQRTADMFIGVPFNIACYAALTMIVAKITGYQPGEFIHTFGDAHIYENHIEQVKEQLTRQPKAFPKLLISDEVTSLETFRPEHLTIEGYDPHPAIKAPLSVTGGVGEMSEIKKKGKQ